MLASGDFSSGCMAIESEDIGAVALGVNRSETHDRSALWQAGGRVPTERFHMQIGRLPGGELAVSGLDPST